MVDFKGDWLAASLRCVACHCGGLRLDLGGWRCEACGVDYPLAGRAANFITPELRSRFRIQDNKKVSDHPYNPTALALLEACKQAGGMALDCGSGSRVFTSPHLIQTEIMAYDNVDLLSVAQNLPFADESFDVVFSFDVLEHVSDPFGSARELARVLKPGGRLFIDLPFLQLEHGYPHHYFNATRMGLRQLFAGLLEAEAHVVPGSGHPAHLVWHALHVYRLGLSLRERAVFEARTIGDVLAGTWKDLRDGPLGQLEEATKWKMAAATQAMFVKTPRASPHASKVQVDVRSLPGFKGKQSRLDLD